MPSIFPPVFNSSESEQLWINHMKLYYDIDQPVRPCVFHVPEDLRDTKPEAYTPQLVGLGPYHHFLPQVQHMGSQKRKTVLKRVKDYNKDFKSLLGSCAEDFESIIRLCYDSYLHLGKEALAWVVIVDGLFLFSLIKGPLSEDEDEDKDKLYSKAEALAPDVFMVENQIPFVLIKKMLGILENDPKFRFDAESRNDLSLFCQKNSPLKFPPDSNTRKDAFDRSKHLLHLMYEMIAKNKSEDPKGKDVNQANLSPDPVGTAGEPSGPPPPNRERNCKRKVSAIAVVVASHAKEFLELAIEEFDSALSNAKVAGIKLPGNVEKVTDILRNVQKNIQHLTHKIDASLGDKIDIPSAWRLYIFLKMKFEKLDDDCGIENIRLDGEKRILYLPVITLRANSEVILRNLAAYEATSKVKSTQMRDYVDLMCGLIKSKKDVDLLVESGIIVKEIPPEEIVKMFEGITKSDEKPDEKSEAAAAAEKAKQKFNNAPIVKFSKCCMQVSADCVKFLRPFFPLAIVLLLAIQSFCELWGCRRRSSLGGEALRDLYLGDMDPKASLMLPRKLMYRY